MRSAMVLRSPYPCLTGAVGRRPQAGEFLFGYHRARQAPFWHRYLSKSRIIPGAWFAWARTDIPAC
jgi:hypothetical protein